MQLLIGILKQIVDVLLVLLTEHALAYWQASVTLREGARCCR